MDRLRVSRAVIRLSDKGLLDRQTHPDDQRAGLLALTSAGVETYGQIVPLAHGLPAMLADPLSATERAQLDRILAKLMLRARRMADPADIGRARPGRRHRWRPRPGPDPSQRDDPRLPAPALRLEPHGNSDLTRADTRLTRQRQSRRIAVG